MQPAESPGDNTIDNLLNGLVKMLINNHFPQKSVKFGCIQYRLLKKIGYL